MNREAEETQAANLAHFMERGPGLSSGYTSFIVKKDTKNQRVLLGGLGGMGVGQMPVPMEENHKNYPGWEEAEDGEVDKPWCERVR